MRRFARGNIRSTRVGGYHSKKEYLRSVELKTWEKIGAIRNLREQVKYELIPKQEGERSCSYIADFVYEFTDSGLRMVEDCKGVCTPDYVIKRKLMLWIHGIRISEI